jgi:hypothetical protein
LKARSTAVACSIPAVGELLAGQLTRFRTPTWSSTRSTWPSISVARRRDLLFTRITEPSQFTSIRSTETLALEGLLPSIGSVGDAYDWRRRKLLVDLQTQVLLPTRLRQHARAAHRGHELHRLLQLHSPLFKSWYRQFDPIRDTIDSSSYSRITNVSTFPGQVHRSSRSCNSFVDRSGWHRNVFGI